VRGQQTGEAVLDELVPRVRVALVHAAPAADIEPVLGARHRHIEQAVIFLPVGTI
jgi:hypothetical protein